MNTSTATAEQVKMLSIHGRAEDLRLVFGAQISLAMGAVAAINVTKGWYDDDRTFGDDIALLHSELSEALEAFRKWGLADATAPYAPAKPEGVGSEFADVFIRLLDSCSRHGIDLAAEFERKLKFNAGRGRRHGGKLL